MAGEGELIMCDCYGNYVFQPQIRTPGPVRAIVPKETADYGIFEIVMVTKNLGSLGALAVALTSIYLAPQLLCGECPSRAVRRGLGCLGLSIRHRPESLFLLLP